MSVFCNAEVMYMCMSRNLSINPPYSACSISSWVRRWTNHSKDRCSRLIQKKSTYRVHIEWNIIYECPNLLLLYVCIGKPYCATFLSLKTESGTSLHHVMLQFGHVTREAKYFIIMDCRMEAKGVTPIPVPMRTACSARKI